MSADKKKTGDLTTQDNHMPAPPKDVITTLDNHMPAPPQDGAVVQDDNHMPAPPKD